MVPVEKKKKNLGDSESYGKNRNLIKKPKTLYDFLFPSGTHVRRSEPNHSKGSRRPPQKRNKPSRTKPSTQIPSKYYAVQAPKVPRTSGIKTDKRGPRKWVPKNKIVYFADIQNSPVETSVTVP